MISQISQGHGDEGVPAHCDFNRHSKLDMPILLTGQGLDPNRCLCFFGQRYTGGPPRCISAELMDSCRHLSHSGSILPPTPAGPPAYGLRSPPAGPAAFSAILVRISILATSGRTSQLKSYLPRPQNPFAKNIFKIALAQKLTFRKLHLGPRATAVNRSP